MPMYLLDTNIVSYWMRGDRQLVDRIKHHSPSDLGLSTITLAEIYYGIEKSPVNKKSRRLKIQYIKSELNIYPFNEQAAKHYGIIRTELEKLGKPISERDTQIASIAAANRLCIVTHNIKEFSRVPNLEVVDWVLSRA